MNIIKKIINYFSSIIATLIVLEHGLFAMMGPGVPQSLLMNNMPTVESHSSSTLTTLNIQLIAASKNGDVQTAHQILSQNPQLNVNAKSTSKDGNTALIWAAKNGSRQIVEELLAQHADINITNNAGQTPCLLAAASNHLDVLKLLIHHGANVNQADQQGYRALMKAVENDNQDTVEYLITAAKADVKLATYLGQTALMIAAMVSSYNFLGLVQLLLEAGANINQQDKNGFTALMYAVYHSNITAAHHLIITLKADFNIISDAGHTALMLAEQNHFSHAITLLRQHGAKKTETGRISVKHNNSFCVVQ